MKHSLFLILILGFNIFSFSQGNKANKLDSIIIYDFNTKQLADFTGVKLGEVVLFRIDSINRFLYDASIKAKNVEYNTEPAPGFADLLKFESTDIGIAGLEAKKIYKQDDPRIQNLNDQNLKESYESLHEQLKDKATNVDSAYKQLGESKALKNRLIRICLRDALTYSEAIIAVEKVKHEYPIYKNLDSLLSAFNKHYNEFILFYKSYLENYTLLIISYYDINRVKASVNALNFEVERMKTAVDGYDYQTLFLEINILFDELTQENNFFLVSDPIQAEKDIIRFDIEIKPKENTETKTILETRKFSLNVPIRGGIKIDFSTGLFFSTCLYDRQYFTSTSEMDSTKIIIHESDNNSIGQIAIGALMHVSPRWIKNIKPAFSFGFAIPITDQARMNIYTGLSCMWGKHRKFIASTGLALGPVDYLKGNYTEGSDYYAEDMTEGITERVWRAGWFISLTYNLTNTVKQ